MYNKVGAKVAVVHQYDRFPDFQKYLFEQFVDWMDTSDLDSEWTAETSCEPFQFQKDVDLFKGICDLSVVGGATRLGLFQI